MAQFSIAAADGSTSVTVDLEWNALSANTWTTVSGDTTVLGTSSGTWIFSSVANTLNMTASSGAAIVQFPSINMAFSTDPFSNVSIGATGETDLPIPPGYMWTRTA